MENIWGWRVSEAAEQKPRTWGTVRGSGAGRGSAS